MNVCQVRGIGEVAVEEAREKESLNLWREKIGNNVQACLPSGPESKERL